MCVYLSSGFKGQCFNYAIPITKSFPPMTSLPYLGLVVLPLRTPRGGFGEKGFQLVPVSWLGLRGSCLEAVPQPRNLSQKVFIAASCREGCSNYPSEIMQGILGDRRSPSSALCKGAVAERESSTYLVRRNKKAPLHVRESAYTNSLWAYVWRMDRHRSESNERQSGVCTKSAKRRFRTQDLRFVER